MRKLMKLTLVTAVLAMSLTAGVPARTADAAEVCEDYCCDPSCTRIIQCYAIGTWCVCDWGCPGYEEIDP
jgi:hypothetical protein